MHSPYNEVGVNIVFELPFIVYRPQFLDRTLKSCVEVGVFSEEFHESHQCDFLCPGFDPYLNPYLK